MPRNLVLFDLEWNIGYQPYTFNYHGVQQTFRGEIVEIPMEMFLIKKL